MSKAINFRKEISMSVEKAVDLTTEALKREGFGILTRIDFHSKIKEKLGKDILPVVILGACNPELAYQAYQRNKDVTGLIPCNAVIRDLGGGSVSIELTKPSAMMEILGEEELVSLSKDADQTLKRVLEGLTG
jgi:uncharacterized protein (DUF302 family)